MTNINTIINKLKKSDIEIYDHKVLEGVHSLITHDMLLLYFPDEKVLEVSFHVITKPDEAALYTLLLKEIRGIKKLYITDVFAYTSEGKYLEGEKAERELKSVIKDKIIQDFVRKQTELNCLINSRGFEC